MVLKLRLASIATLLAGSIVMAQQPRRVDDALLKTGSKSGDEWVSYGVNWSEQRYSPLNQINASNVNRLGLALAYDIPLAPGNPPQLTRKERRWSSMASCTASLRGASSTPSI